MGTNRYAYAGGDPVNGSDPGGNLSSEPWSPDLAAVAKNIQDTPNFASPGGGGGSSGSGLGLGAGLLAILGLGGDEQRGTALTQEQTERGMYRDHDGQLRERDGTIYSGDYDHSSRTTAWRFYKRAGWSAARIDDHMAGIDFSKGVNVMILLAGSEVVQYGVPGRPVGNYFARKGTSASELGINPAGREAQIFRLKSDVMVLRSVAAPIVDHWTNPSSPFSASGGGEQYFTLDPDQFELVQK